MNFAQAACLYMANGMTLEEVLDQHAAHLADELRARADRWVNTENPVNGAVVTGLRMAADQIDPEEGKA